ncbi:16S rRNA (cytidine(1402)-2'-O)-methyltransferase [Desulfovibrio litoralis]|uniref:Ribosomal RNA small subunit methyltransferase I n=1 Tax=Desulfovibrio litoralis DSM 11393 TaxID=1121455 RepID=A0A1M7TEF3_9BACT|nr:16S rRNA (cytidine(1402)-2'-O)-methyltransferase [Desulfovibrio litoralis]SHN69105.1 16S rRNA (cytidine1402-2'-O)-methyltransferase [Desulfovibrio litoralis DSM 11393]
MLWIVATPLGNPADLSFRAKETLTQADLILAEDTRRAGLICQRCGVVPKAFLSFHEHNEVERQEQILNELKQGKNLALISDAGTPLMADPGYRLVRACRQEGLEVSPIPGASAPIVALSASGLPPQPFTFFGFLPRKQSEKEKIFQQFVSFKSTLVFFERKDRVKESLELAFKVLGKREFCIARELTKTYEEFILSTLDKWEDLSEELLGELTIIIAPSGSSGTAERTDLETLKKLVEKGLTQQLKVKELAKLLKTQTEGWSLKELYAFIEAQK